MKRILLSALVAGVIGSVAAMVVVADPPRPANEPKRLQRYDPTGRELQPGKDPVKPAADVPVRKKARFELYQETSPGFKCEIEVVFDPRVYPYKILSGTITGSFGGPWRITEGTFGPRLLIKATNGTGTPHQAEDVVIQGAAVHPSGYTGTYDFSPNGSAFGFKHNTLLTGFSDP